MKFLQSLAVLVLVGLAAGTAQAQLRLGFHAGADASPDAITLGVHASYPVGQTGMYVVPGVSYGFRSQQDILGEEFDFRSFRRSVYGAHPIPLADESLHLGRRGPLVVMIGGPGAEPK